MIVDVPLGVGDGGERRVGDPQAEDAWRIALGDGAEIAGLLELERQQPVRVRGVDSPSWLR